ncbi:hypothetical protein GCM10008927_09870 [Amylibacter ulvae]|uniref:DUF2125 domain-containing protein n=1 Tax=Paramylibacter ulvae TaxID=1651968 RepID=A0ABQ3CWB9_9RHOB|nr:DUF2125 domain-containing protein [Amylibacter ulvae]GHA47121.1 hypothetical protein GCM10008927_09870 [Amylibacter ulvae]
MFQPRSIFASTLAITTAMGGMAFSEEQATKILEEYFDIFKSTPLVASIGNKDDARGHTQWDDIILKTEDGDAEISIPWVRVDKKLLGGHVLTIAPETTMAFEVPDADDAPKVEMTMTHTGMETNVSGEEGARSFETTFDNVAIKSTSESMFTIDATMTDGKTNTTIMGGDDPRSKGDFSFADLTLNYGFTIEDQKTEAFSSTKDLSGDFNMPIFGDFAGDNPFAGFDASKEVLINYRTGEIVSKSSATSPMGPINFEVNANSSDMKLSLLDNIANMTSNGSDIDYKFESVGLGMPPMDLSIAGMVSEIQIPIENMDDAKPAKIKMVLSEMALSDTIWGMFDPTAKLPRDNIDLNIDAQGDMRWTKTIADVSADPANPEPPVQMDNLQVNALNLNAAGAKLVTTGALLFHNMQFPPQVEGSMNVDLQGAQALLKKLTEIGLVPAQNAMMIQGMSAMFFRPGGGDDHLISEIKLSKDGGITANGMPIK